MARRPGQAQDTVVGRLVTKYEGLIDAELDRQGGDPGIVTMNLDPELFGYRNNGIATKVIAKLKAKYKAIGWREFTILIYPRRTNVLLFKDE